MYKKLKDELGPIGYEVKKRDDGELFISHQCIPWTIRVLKEDDFFYPMFYFRTYFGLGERTDFHEIFPIISALFFRASGKYSFRFLGQHNEWSGIDDELYGNFIFPSQPLSERIRSNSPEDIESFKGILIGLVLLQNNMAYILDVDCEKEEQFGFEGKELAGWVGKIKKAVGENASCVYNERSNPDWFYFRSFSDGVSVIKSSGIARFANYIFDENKVKHKSIAGVTGRLYISDEIKNCVDNERYSAAINIINSLECETNPLVIPNENLAFIIGKENIVSITNDGGISCFFDQKEKVKIRNAQENTLLFGDKRIVWDISDRVDSGLFEDLILELLSREPHILSSKKVAPTNQGDNGRDIICEYNAKYKDLRVGRHDPSLQIGKLIVQCKTNLEGSKKSSIGKRDVDVADTIYDYKPDAYLLVVNSQITRDLTEYLEKIKSRNELHWLEWWNSFDVEERLRMNPDIMSRYKDIVGYE